MLLGLPSFLPTSEPLCSSPDRCAVERIVRRSCYELSHIYLSLPVVDQRSFERPCSVLPKRNKSGTWSLKNILSPRLLSKRMAFSGTGSVRSAEGARGSPLPCSPRPEFMQHLLCVPCPQLRNFPDLCWCLINTNYVRDGVIISALPDRRLAWLLEKS